MKTQLRNSVISAILAAACVLISTSASAAEHSNKRIVFLFTDSRDCTIFRLQGVTVADPNVQRNDPQKAVWFALSTKHRHYNQNYAVLLGSKLAGTQVHVSTTGKSACTYAEVRKVASP